MKTTFWESLLSQKETDTKSNKAQGIGNILQNGKKYVIKGPTLKLRPALVLFK